ncbi:hypothetical protein J4476_04865 [Candidatus Woesearchaeota archaeon]|nr:MAG: hypothetical protein QT09_C0004G0038 [archaeon GW2011_AR18]MBS3161995.1 hypothetical protein [Candidatus Woesearchaeota archaeon]HIH25846.1 hypothetical protein [Nanoarchaeota archaeon]
MIKKIKNSFICEELPNNKLSIKYNKLSKEIIINKKDLFNEDYASLAGMIPDGSLIKDLMRVYFHQKKDLRKIDLFAVLISKLFSPKSTILYKADISGMQCYINSQTLARFMYHILEIPKSDESMRVPNGYLIPIKMLKLLI